jgi:hypothetical protein
MKKILAPVLLCSIALSFASPRQTLCDEYEETLVSLLPASGSIEGWERDGEHLIYYADELWEYINGAAEGFLAYDVEAVVAQDYVSAAGWGLKLEIYDHQTPLMGFGIYSQHRDPELKFIDIGAEGFGDEYSIQCWKGRYYIKINVFETGEELSRAMRRFAGKVAADIPGEASFPLGLGAFPEEGLVERSLTYLTEGVLGRGRFPHAFAGGYELEGASGRLYLFPLGGAGEADALADWYAGETGAALSGSTAGQEAYRYGTGKDPYQGEVSIFTYRSWAGVVTGFEKHPEVRRGIVEDAVRELLNLELPTTPAEPKLEPVR